MKARVPVAWLQLAKSKSRLLAAVAGIAFAAILMLVHTGVSDAMFESAVLVHAKLKCEIVITAQHYQMVIRSQSFTERRLYQALGVEGVESVVPVYLGMAPWKNPWTRQTREIFMMGFEPRAGVFDLPEINENLDKIREPGRILFDARARPEFGPVAEAFRQKGEVVSEVAAREARVAGLFSMGTSFGVDGSLITSDLTFLRLLPNAKAGLIGLGLVRLKPGADPETVRSRLARALPKDVNVLTRQQLMEQEMDYWASNTPIGFSTSLGVVMGWIVGAVIVYQILYSDVSSHLPEYATLKAMGYTDLYLFGIVMKEAFLLSVMGFLPAVLASEVVYRITYQATLLPISMTWERALTVYAFTIALCGVSGLLAALQVRRADPAEIF